MQKALIIEEIDKHKEKIGLKSSQRSNKALILVQILGKYNVHMISLHPLKIWLT